MALDSVLFYKGHKFFRPNGTVYAVVKRDVTLYSPLQLDDLDFFSETGEPFFPSPGNAVPSFMAEEIHIVVEKAKKKGRSS